jgi:hypothetical protein
MLSAGCVAHQVKGFNAELTHFVGKPLPAITKYIGPPDSKLEVLGNTVYAWGTPDSPCKLQLTTDRDGVITTYHWEGYMPSCAKFTDALDIE